MQDGASVFEIKRSPASVPNSPFQLVVPPLKGPKSPIAVREESDQTHRYEHLMILNVDRSFAYVGAAHWTTY